MPATLQAIPMDRSLFNGEGPWVIRVYDIDAETMTALNETFDVWGVDSDDRYAIVGVANRGELERLRGMGHTLAVDPNASARYRTPLMLGFGGDTIPNFSCYRTVEATFATAQAMVQNHPQLAQLIDIGDSWEKSQNSANGYDMWVLKLTNQNIVGEKPKLFVTSAIHARELTTAELMTRFAERLVEGYGIDADSTWILDHQEVHLLLQTNPDGRKRAESGLLWRKNTNQNYCGATSNSRGADLNRNFPWQWGGAASTSPCGETYQGPSPGSEPEVMAVSDYILNIFPDRRGDGLNDPAPLDTAGVYIDVHSFSQLVLWPYGFSNSAPQAPNQAQLSTLGRRLAFFNGYRPQQILGLTAASGSTADFSYGELGVASYAFEIGTEFFQQCAFFENAILEQNLNAMMYAAKVSRTPYQTPSGPDVTQLRLLPNTLLIGDPATLTLNADGTRFSTVVDSTSPQEPPRQISGVEIHLDQLPWASPATAMASADDGVFDEISETATANIDSSALGVGQHLVYTRAVGQDGQTGAISAAYLQVLDAATAARLFGQVRFAGTSIAVPGVLVEANGFHTLSDSQGNYDIDLSAGTYDVGVSGDDVAGSSVEVSLATSEQRQLNLEVFARCDVFVDDVENGNQGWTTTGNWAIVTEQSTSPSHSWHDSPGGNYGNNQNFTLTGPSLDLSQASEARLDFQHICDTEVGFDFGIVEVSANGGAWQEVYRCDNQIAWQAQAVGIGMLDGIANARFRFRLSTDIAMTDNGWYLDDIRVSANSPGCNPEDPDLILNDGFESLP